MSFRMGLLGLAMLALAGSAMATGAIAVDDEEGDEDVGYGIATGHDSKDAAQKAALAQCRKAGNKNCRIAVWFEGCGAYASSKKYYGVGWGKTLKAAESKALEACGRSSCAVEVSECD